MEQDAQQPGLAPPGPPRQHQRAALDAATICLLIVLFVLVCLDVAILHQNLTALHGFLMIWLAGLTTFKCFVIVFTKGRYTQDDLPRSARGSAPGQAATDSLSKPDVQKMKAADVGKTSQSENVGNMPSNMSSNIDVETAKRTPTQEEMHAAATKIARRWRLHHKEKKAVQKRRAICNWNCIRSLCCFVFSYVVTVFLFGFVSLASRELSILLLSIVPQMVIAYFAEQWYPAYVTRCTMVDVMAEAFFFIIPLVFAIAYIDPKLNLRGGDTCTEGDDTPSEVWKVALYTWGRAAFLEELLKYLAIRRLVHKAYVVDPRSFLVYGFLAGTTFGYIENIGYGMLGGVGLVVFRCFLNVTRAVFITRGVCVGR